MSDGNVLETLGSIHIEAQASGENLQLGAGKIMQADFPNEENLEGMQAFEGVQENNQFNWVPDRKDRRPVKSITIFPRYENDEYPLLGIDSAELASFQNNEDFEVLKKTGRTILEVSKLGWLNCDRFNKAEPKTRMMVKIDNPGTIRVRLVFREIQSVMAAGPIDNNNFIFENIPVGMKASLVAFSLYQDEPYYAIRDITTKPEQTEFLPLLPTTISDLKEELENLN
jgi:hypothetical protein